jgi:hypothetical protein
MRSAVVLLNWRAAEGSRKVSSHALANEDSCKGFAPWFRPSSEMYFVTPRRSDSSTKRTAVVWMVVERGDEATSPVPCAT